MFTFLLSCFSQSVVLNSFFPHPKLGRFSPFAYPVLFLWFIWIQSFYLVVWRCLHFFLFVWCNVLVGPFNTYPHIPVFFFLHGWLLCTISLCLYSPSFINCMMKIQRISCSFSSLRLINFSSPAVCSNHPNFPKFIITLVVISNPYALRSWNPVQFSIHTSGHQIPIVCVDLW